MSKSPRDAERREIRQAYKKAERDAARAAMVLDLGQLEALLDAVEERLDSLPCDHSLRHAMEWAAAQHVDAEALTRSLRHFGGYCDCEVVFNVDTESIFGVERTSTR
jgi:hypothetical protein